MKNILMFFSIWTMAVAVLLAQTPLERARDTFVVSLDDLMLVDYPGDPFENVQKEKGISDEEISTALIDAYKTLDPNLYRGAPRSRALSLLSFHPSTNALPFLESVFATENNEFGFSAIVAYLRISQYSDSALEKTCLLLNKLSDDISGYEVSVYSLLSFVLRYDHPDEETKGRILHFLKGRLGNETLYPSWVDSMICAGDPLFANSPERKTAIDQILANPKATENTKKWASSALEVETTPNTPEPRTNTETEVEPCKTNDVDLDEVTPGESSVPVETRIDEVSPSIRPLAVSAIAITLLGVVGFLLRQHRCKK